MRSTGGKSAGHIPDRDADGDPCPRAAKYGCRDGPNHMGRRERLRRIDQFVRDDLGSTAVVRQLAQTTRLLTARVDKPDRRVVFPQPLLDQFRREAQMLAEQAVAKMRDLCLLAFVAGLDCEITLGVERHRAVCEVRRPDPK
ncbi:MAG TPA: hypothetical protein VEX68_01820 [Bryobacteraceae bacterium]|nr:hypothetical protein [Bryobacteraceae bacterium]